MFIRRKTYKDLLRKLENQERRIEEWKRRGLKSITVCKGDYVLDFTFGQIDDYLLSTLEDLISALRESAEKCLVGTKEDFMLHGKPTTFDPYTKQEINKLKISTLSALGEFITHAANDLSYRSGNVSKSDFERLSSTTYRALEKFLKGVGEDLPL